MKWNSEDIRKKGEYLTKLYNESTLEKEKKELKKEIAIMSNMLESITCSAFTKARHNYEIEVKKENLDKKCDFFAHSLPEIIDRVTILEYSRRLPLYWITRLKIDEKEYIKLVEEFLTSFKFDLKPLYSSLVANQRINVSEQDYFNVKGICYYFPILNETYINILFNNKIDDCRVLPHELGHAYLIDGVNTLQKYNMTVSSLGEAFSMFMQLAFYDYLKETKYFRNAINMERDFLENLASIYELNRDLYAHANDVKVIDNRFVNSYHKTFSGNTANIFLSKMLAYYLINLYRNGNIEEIKNFIEAYKNNTEYEYFKNINSEIFKDSLKSEFDYFYQSMGKHKSLVKNR